jgi:hypothetical protein
MIRTPSWTGRMAAMAVVSLLFSGAAVTGLAGPAATAGASGAAGGSGRELVGLFRLTPGSAVGSHLSGTWFRMLQPDATVANGPFMTNANSSADGGQATLLQPGTAGGFRTGTYQSEPNPAFDSGGNSLAGAITKPTEFFNVKFSISTNKIDPQTKTACAPPVVVLKNGKLTADLSSWAASWNKQNFNQGAPKPVQNTGAKSPGQQQAQKVWSFVSKRFLGSATKASITGASATGSYNAKTGAFSLQWTSLIVGGPFNGFTGLWHLAGVFQPSGRASSGS